MIFFIHIPKAGGTTIHSIAFMNYPKAKIMKYKPNEMGAFGRYYWENSE